MCGWLFMHGLSSSSWANFSLPGFQEKGLSFVITLLIHHNSQGGAAYAGGEVREKVRRGFSSRYGSVLPAPSLPTHSRFLTEECMGLGLGNHPGVWAEGCVLLIAPSWSCHPVAWLSKR